MLPEASPLVADAKSTSKDIIWVCRKHVYRHYLGLRGCNFDLWGCQKHVYRRHLGLRGHNFDLWGCQKHVYRHHLGLRGRHLDSWACQKDVFARDLPEIPRGTPKEVTEPSDPKRLIKCNYQYQHIPPKKTSMAPQNRLRDNMDKYTIT